MVAIAREVDALPVARGFARLAKRSRAHAREALRSEDGDVVVVVEAHGRHDLPEVGRQRHARFDRAEAIRRGVKQLLFTGAGAQEQGGSVGKRDCSFSLSLASRAEQGEGSFGGIVGLDVRSHPVNDEHPSVGQERREVVASPGEHGSHGLERSGRRQEELGIREFVAAFVEAA
jgi:hypothetical protein